MAHTRAIGCCNTNVLSNLTNLTVTELRRHVLPGATLILVVASYQTKVTKVLKSLLKKKRGLRVPQAPHVYQIQVDMFGWL